MSDSACKNRGIHKVMFKRDRGLANCNFEHQANYLIFYFCSLIFYIKVRIVSKLTYL